MYRTIIDQIKRIVADLPGQPNVEQPDVDEIRRRSEQYGTKTIFGNYNYVSNVKNLSTALTVYIGRSKIDAAALTQKKRDILNNAPDTIKSVHKYIEKAPIVMLETNMGSGSSFTPRCRYFLSTYRKDSIRLANMVANTLFPPNGVSEPELTVIHIPEWQEKERQVLVFPEIGVTYILGTDFYGEVKNAFLRMAMWSAKQRGMLGMHAGTNIIRAKGANGKLRNLGIIMFGIAATGKTTHSCHDHGLVEEGERVEIVQDDVVFWQKDGSALGSERGFYIKTEGLDPETQPLLYEAATRESAILENVMVSYDGVVHFDNRTLTANGHGIIQRDELRRHAAEGVNLPPLSELDGLIIAFMVRSYTVVPIAGKLTPEQAAIAFMMSESIDTSGSDSQSPSGGIGASPYLIGNAAEDVNIFYNLLKAHSNKIECYMLNTGGVGEIVEHGLDGARKVRQKVTRVLIPEMASIIRGIARGTIRWREDPNWMIETPEYVEGLDISKFDLNRHYDQDKIDSLMASVRLERLEYAEQFPGLLPEIRKAAEF